MIQMRVKMTNGFFCVCGLFYRFLSTFNLIVWWVIDDDRSIFSVFSFKFFVVNTSFQRIKITKPSALAFQIDWSLSLTSSMLSALTDTKCVHRYHPTCYHLYMHYMCHFNYTILSTVEQLSSLFVFQIWRAYPPFQKAYVWDQITANTVTTDKDAMLPKSTARLNGHYCECKSRTCCPLHTQRYEKLLGCEAHGGTHSLLRPKPGPLPFCKLCVSSP